MVDKEHWKSLGRLDSRMVCDRTGAEFNTRYGYYLLPFLAERLLIHPGERWIRWQDEALQNATPPSYNHQIVAAIYLLTGAGALCGPYLGGIPDEWIHPQHQ